MEVNLTISANSQKDFALLVSMLSVLAGTGQTAGISEAPVINLKTSENGKHEEKPEKELVDKVLEETKPVTIPAKTQEDAKKVVTLSLETLRANTATAIEKGFKDQVKKKLTEMKAPNVAALKEDQYETWNKFVTDLVEDSELVS